MKKLAKGPLASSLPCMLLLALFFLGGAILGQVLAGRVPGETGLELRQYLEDYVRLGGEVSPGAAVSAAAVYFRYPLLAFLLGFASIGVVLLPVSAAAFGFFLSFAVCCFTAAFGPDGVLLALAALGLRCVVTMPCFFLLASSSCGTAAGLAAVSFGSGRRTAPGLRAGGLEAVRRLFSGAGRGRLRGADADARAAAAGAGTCAWIGMKGERGPWQKTISRITARILRESGMPPRIPSPLICGM